MNFAELGLLNRKLALALARYATVSRNLKCFNERTRTMQYSSRGDVMHELKASALHHRETVIASSECAHYNT